MAHRILADADALAHPIIPLCYQIGLLDNAVILKSVGADIARISQSPDPKKQEAGRRAAFTIVRLHSMPHVRVITDTHKPTASHADDDLLTRARRSRARILTADIELQTRARAAGVGVISVQDLKRGFKSVSEELAGLFPPKRDLGPGDVLRVRIDKPGRENGQGLAFLPDPDDRLVVVHNGQPHIGAEVDVLVEHVSKSPIGEETIFASI